MNYRRLSDDITDAVIQALQHFEFADKVGQPMTFDEVQSSLNGAVERYRNDPIFRAKAQSLVARIMAIVVLHDNETPPQQR